jgi:hypothetical protein
MKDGYYWVKIAKYPNLPATVGERVTRASTACWFIVGSEMDFSYDELVVLSGRLRSPTAKAGRRGAAPANR